MDTAFRQVGRPCVFGGSVVVLTIFILMLRADSWYSAGLF